jgi:hypothetical protein
MASYQSHVFLNEWQGGDEQTLKQAFDIGDQALAEARVLLASYLRDEYYGEAFVLFCRRGKLYEVNASHDSLAGMAGQWEPEETLLEALHYRLEKGTLGSGTNGANVFADELRFLLAELEAC